MRLRERHGFHDGVTRAEFVLVMACFAWMTPIFIVVAIADWFEDRRAHRQRIAA